MNIIMRKLSALLLSLALMVGASSFANEMASTPLKDATTTVKRTPAAKMETFNLVVDEYTSDFYVETNEVYIEMIADSGAYQFTFDIFVPEGANDLVLGQVYTLADMNADYTEAYKYFAIVNNYYPIATVGAASFVKNKDASGQVNISASFTLVNGDIYNLTYQGEDYQEEPQPGDIETIVPIVPVQDEMDSREGNGTSNQGPRYDVLGRPASNNTNGQVIIQNRQKYLNR